MALWLIRAGKYGEHEQRFFADSACYLTWEGTEDRDLHQAKDYEGIKAEIDFGSSGEGDGDSTHYGFAFGTAIGDGGNFVVGVEGENSDGILKCASARDWCGTNTGVIPNWQPPSSGPRLPTSGLLPPEAESS